MDIADNLIYLANQKNYFVNNSKIQKLVYYAQAWYLGIHKIPLFKEDFEAWTNGPVIPVLYEEYKKFEWQPIVKKTPHEIPRVVMDFLDIVTKKYLIFDCYELEQMIRKEPPWDLARGDLLWDAPSNAIIKKEWIKEYYISRVESWKDDESNN
ncbi:hypothetical protein BI308_14775 [Roseofilum reptotaenium AO1-A]|uniref:Antitoxin SocA-like Panacea domain-containing protein n=1 Tax=Roseofilum reptotaenium AO1-A TaxID=1925591 RepID=A0A1L9QQE9_9CYAN|nr:hypothetical protein BI308_14775 [Roseofilum reptotaenium AO1-A]